MTGTPEPWQYYEGDPSEDAAEALADAMGDPTHPMHEEDYEAEEEAFTRRCERQQLGARLRHGVPTVTLKP